MTVDDNPNYADRAQSAADRDTVGDESEVRDPLLLSLFDAAANGAEQEKESDVLAFVGRVSESINRRAARRRSRNKLIGFILVASLAVIAATPGLFNAALTVLLVPTGPLIEVETLGVVGSAEILLVLFDGLFAPINSAAGLLGVIAFFMRRTLFRLILRR